MGLELMIYLASVSNKVSATFIVFGSIFSLITIGCLEAKVDGKVESWKYFIGSLVIAFITMAIGVLIPSKDAIYSIAAVKMGKELSKNEKVIETSDKVYKLLNQKLDELIEKNEHEK